MSLCNILAVSWEYFAKLICNSTALYHSSTDWSPYLKLISKSNLAFISFVCGLQNSSNFCQLISKHVSSVLNPMRCTGLCQSHQTRPLLSCTFLLLRALPIHNPIYFSHFIFHLMKLLYKLSSTVQFILGPSMYGTYILVGACCCLTNTSCSLSDSCS